MKAVLLLAACSGTAAALLGQPGRAFHTPNKSHGRRSSTPLANLLDAFLGKKTFDAPCVMGEDSIMSPKAHGTTPKRVQSKLRWSCRDDLADRICSFNRHYAENAGYWERSATFLSEEEQSAGDTTFYDSVTGKPLFYAPRERSWEAFVKESRSHGWPSFRDSEVNWEYVRVLPNGECVSVDGTHLGHNLPDRSGNRYCINLVSVAGLPEDGA